MRRESLYGKGMYLPAITIIALALILTVIVTISSYRTISRGQRRLNENLLREGKILLDVFKERTASEILIALLNGDGWETSLQRLAEDMTHSPMVKYMLIADAGGKITVHSQPDRIGDTINAVASSSGRITTNEADKSKVFELSLPFRPFKDELFTDLSSTYKSLIRENSIEAAFRNHWAIIGMNMQEFERVRAEDIRHTIMMGAMMLIMGSASLYFIVVAQNYYLVNRALSTMQTYTQNVVESMVNGLISVDDSGVITTINPMAAQIAGIDESSAKGQHISDVLKSDDFGIQELLAADKPIFEREIVCQCNEEPVPLSVSSSQLRDEVGKFIGAVVIIRDLREIKELQEKVRRVERLASLGRLAAGIAHEIRNPLSSIRGFAHYFQGRFDPETKDVQYARAMVGEIDRLNRIIESLLDFARPAEPDLQPASIEDILDHTLQLIQTDIDAKGAQVFTDIADDIPDAMLDRDQMIQALLNILLNAVNAIDKGGEIGISVYPETSSLQIVVSDTGSGISGEDIPRIFDPFFTTRRDGTGLGLAIVHRIIENHGGEIGVDSKIGKGATFTIRLPLHREGNKDV